MTQSKPELASLLEKSGVPGLVEQVAEQIADYMGSTKKFIDFVLEFLPDPPERRPVNSRFEWTKENFRKALKEIYRHRSKALHGGTPFPLPMCWLGSPVSHDINGSIFPEIPLGEAMMARGGSWKKNNTPMLLHTFEHIARNTIINWLLSVG